MRRESLSPGGGGSPGSGGNGSPFMRHRGSMVDEFDASPGNASPYDELGHMGHGALHAAPIDLPLPTLETLPAIARILTEASLFQREGLAGQMLAPGFLPRLLASFKTAEDLEDEGSLAAAYAVVKAAILINDTALLETLFCEEYAMDVIGALEYDPEISPVDRPRHREYLAGPGALREVVPIADPMLRSKILQAHRMGYIKDVVLPRALDDSTFATLSSLQLFNQVEVLVALQADSEFFPQLFTALKAAPPGDEKWRDLVGFLQELVGLARHLQASQRNGLLSRLVDLGLFPVLASVLISGDADARLRAADVLLANVAHDPGPLRAYLQGDGSQLFLALVAAVLDPEAAGLQEQALEILKVLLDPETMDSSVEKDRFIDSFYDNHVARLLGAVVAAGEGGPADPGTLILVMDLLCYCVTQHSYRIKYYILRNNVVEKVLRLLRRRERAVAAAALRFLRTCLAMRDEFYNRYLVKNALLEPVLTAFLANGQRYNLLNSAVLELLEFLRRENMKGLVGAVVDSSQFERLESECDYVDTFKRLKLRHEANQEGRTGGGPPGAAAVGPPQGGAAHGPLTGLPIISGIAVVPKDANRHDQQQQHQQRESSAAVAAARAAAAAQARRMRGEREEDADEENYFREDDDDGEEEAAHPEPHSHSIGPGGGHGQVVLEGLSPLPGLLAGRLVDYGEDEEDDDTLPLGALSRAARSETPKRGATGQPAGGPPEKRSKGAEET